MTDTVNEKQKNSKKNIGKNLKTFSESIFYNVCFQYVPG